MNRRLFQWICGVTLLCLHPLCGGLEFRTDLIEASAGWGDEQRTARFPFVNSSDRTITIQRVSTSCGCTAATPAKTVYASGESGEIEAVFTFGNRQGMQRNRITVQTDAGAYQLNFNVEIPVAWTLADRVLVWREVEGVQPRTTKFTVHDPSVTDVEVARDPDDWTVRFDRADDEANVWTIEATPTEVRRGMRSNLVIRLKRGDDTDLFANLFLRVL